MLIVVDHTIWSSYKLITLINLGLHLLGPPPSPAIRKLERSKTKNKEISKCAPFFVGFFTMLLFVDFVMFASSYLVGMKRPSKADLSKMKATWGKVIHQNSKKLKVIFKPSGQEVRVVISASPQPLSPFAMVVLSDNVVASPLYLQRGKVKKYSPNHYLVSFCL